MNISIAKDIRLVIQPIHSVMVHEYVFEGPCRFGIGDELTLDFDRMNGAVGFDIFRKNLAEYLNDDAFEVLPPLECEITEAFEISNKMMQDLMVNDSRVDCYLFYSVGRTYPIMMRLAELSKKPIVLSPKCCGNTMVPAQIRSRGLECLSPMRWSDMADMLKVYRVRKILKQSRALLLTRGYTNGAYVSAPDGAISLDDLTARFGTEFCCIDVHEFLDQTVPCDCTDNHTKPGIRGLNLTEEDMNEIACQADSLIAGASECTMSRENVIHSLRFYKTTLKMLEHYECNAFSAPCPEMCATRRLNENKFTPCITHSLLNGCGISSACEYDVPGLLTQIILSSFANAGAYMGNTSAVIYEKGTYTPTIKTNPENGYRDSIDGFDDETKSHLAFSFHSSMNLHMRGYDAPEMEYAIHPYTGSRWGATFRHDFALDEGQPITLARISPDGGSIFVASGKVAGSIGHDLDGCTQGIFFTVDHPEDFYEKQCNFGNHLPIVFGNYYDQVVALGKLLGLQVVTA